MTVFVFDGSMEGFLTALFDYYEVKPGFAKVASAARFEPSLLDAAHDVIADEAKAARVWNGLKKKLDPSWLQRFYYVFLSETEEGYNHLFDFARYVFDHPEGAASNFGNPSVMAVAQWAKSVSRERHRMKAFIRFQETADGIFYAPVEPDFNVLPLISSFFKNRYADQAWIIYDVRRKYGLHYDLHHVQEVTFDFEPETKSATTYLPASSVAGKEELFGLLWQDYFRNTNIPARKNMTLHIRHVPKRYWKYLTEKSGHN